MVENSSHLHGCEQLTRFGDDFLLIVGWFFVVVVFFIFVLFACCVDEACICICLKKIDFVTVSFGIYLRNKLKRFIRHRTYYVRRTPNMFGFCNWCAVCPLSLFQTKLSRNNPTHIACMQEWTDKKICQ